MKLAALLFLLTLMTGLQSRASTTFAPLTCDGFLNAPVSKLGIGVLARDSSGNLLLGVSPYAGSLHDNIVYELLDTSNASEIVWMGEVRYSKINEIVELHEANETSGFYSRHSQAPLIIGDRTIPIANCVTNLPSCARSQNFQGYSFQSGEHFRLAEELKEVKGDVRHSIGNSLNIVSSVARIITSPFYSIERKTMATANLKTSDASHLRLVSWLLKNLTEDARIDAKEIRELQEFVAKLLVPDWTVETFKDINAEVIQNQVQRVAAFTVPGKTGKSVEIYRLDSK